MSEDSLRTDSDSAHQQPKSTAVEIQQEYYEAIGDTDWELYRKQDRPFLLQKVAIALCGPPTKEGNLKTGDDLQLQGYEKREEEITQQVFQKICEQAKYAHDNESILISIIRVVCVSPSTPVPFYKLTPSDYWVDLHTKKDDITMCIFHVFSVRKCIATKVGAVKGCRVFIDHDGRVYHTWNEYLTENKLPECVMVVPENGEYRGTLSQDIDLKEDPSTVMPLVKCLVVPSPALGIGAKVLSVVDITSTVANVGALAGVAGAFFLPVVAPVAIPTAIGVGVATGVYGIARSTVNLIDRKKHEQSIGLQDAEARAGWINIMVSTAGISATGATKLLSWAAASGTNVEILMHAVRVLQYTNLGTGFIGDANSLSDMIIKYAEYNETPTTLEVFQFTTSALFLGLGVMTNQTAQEIVQDAQARTINEIRDSLPSNVKKKMFDKVTAETRRVQGTIKGNADVIKALNKIENKNDFFAKLARINKQANKNQLRISLSPDGNPLFNNQHKIGVNDLHGLGKIGRDQLFAKYGPATVNTKNAPTRIYESSNSINGTNWFQDEYNFFITSIEIIKISNFLMSLSKVDQEMVAEILSQITGYLHDAFLLFCTELIASFLSFEIEILKNQDPHYKVSIVLYVFNYIKSLIPMDADDIDLSFSNVLKEFVVKGKVEAKTILKIKDVLIQRAQKLKKHNEPNIFSDMYNFRKTYKTREYTILEAGEIFTIGEHNILVKNNTVEKLEEWLEMFSQKECDMFMKLCYKIVSRLSSNEINTLIEINFDEDIIMRVSSYMLFVNEIVIDLLGCNISDEELLSNMSLNLKDHLIEWRKTQTIRSYEICNECSGIRYIIDK